MRERQKERGREGQLRVSDREREGERESVESE